MKAKRNAVSPDSPDFFRNNHSLLHDFGNNQRKQRGKQIIPQLTQGISDESPDIFHTKYTISLKTEDKNRIISGDCYEKGLFTSQLKKNQLSPIKKFQYTDYTNEGLHDYHTFKPSIVNDLLADKKPTVKQKNEFYEIYKQRLNSPKGFSLGRGEFTLNAEQPKVERFRVGKLIALQDDRRIQRLKERSQPVKPMYSDTNKTNFRAASTIRSSSLERRQVKKDLGVSGEISKFEKNMPLSARVVLGGTSNRLYSTLYKW